MVTTLLLLIPLLTSAALTAVNENGHLAAAGKPEISDRIAVHHDRQNEVTNITICAVKGKVTATDIAQAFARAAGWDDRALADVAPAIVPIDLTRVGTRLLIGTMSAAFGRGLRMQVQSGRDEPQLDILINNTELLASRRRFKRRLRNISLFVLRRKATPKAYGLTLDAGWQDVPARRNLVILVHGFQSSPDAHGEILKDVRKYGFACGTFHYPNDQPIIRSARTLAHALAGVKKQEPARDVTLLTLSMGGLLARAMVEDAALDPGNVDQLIMVAPPTHGSVMAHFGYGLDIWEHVVRTRERDTAQRLFAAIEDGFAEAVHDLRPGSPMLKQLNSRPRNPKVRTTIFLGSGAPLRDQELALMRRSFKRAGKANRFVRILGPRVDGWLADLEEVVQGKGDGAVAVKRGRLDGVRDTVVLGFDHQQMMSDPNDAASRKLRAEILQRILAEHESSASPPK